VIWTKGSIQPLGLSAPASSGGVYYGPGAPRGTTKRSADGGLRRPRVAPPLPTPGDVTAVPVPVQGVPDDTGGPPGAQVRLDDPERRWRQPAPHRARVPLG